MHCTNDTTGVCGVGWEYTPQDQVDAIQRKVLSALEELYKELEVKCLYKLQE